MNTKMILGALAQDLYRVGISYHSGSNKTAGVFMRQVQERVKKLDDANVKPYLRSHLHKIKKLSKEKENNIVAEHALMYGDIVQNYCLKYE